MPLSESTFFQVLPSPLGRLGVTLADGKVVRLEVLPDGTPGSPASPIRPGREARVLAALQQQLSSYFSTTCRTFNVPIALAGDDLEHRVWSELLLLGFGQCVNLQSLADRVKTADLESVAQALRACPIAILVPTHRVMGWDQEPLPWVAVLRTLEDIVPGETTVLIPTSLPTTAQEIARATARAPHATLHRRS